MSHLNLSPDQNQALSEILEFIDSDQWEHALSGPAGTGKTFLLRYVLLLAERQARLTATTNKAAHVAASLSPGSEARTIHSLLGLQPEPDVRRGRMVLKAKRDPKVKRGDLVVVDEASMVDSDLLRVIRHYAREIGFQTLFVGDSYQLPPIFENECPVFAAVPTSHLTTVHRQALDNPVLATATAFREVLDGAPFPLVHGHERGLVRAEGVHFVGRMLEEFGSREYQRDPDHCRAICWTNARAHELNQLVRRQLIGPEADRWPILPGEEVIVNEALVDDDELIFPTEARVMVNQVQSKALVDKTTGIKVMGQRVMVSDGEKEAGLFVPSDRAAAKALLSAYASQARVLQAQCQTPAPGSNVIELDDARRAAWRRFFEVKRQLADLRPPHASTTHKSQGSTIGSVFIDLGDIGNCTRPDLTARLCYVALTRARHEAIVTGDLPARLYLREAA